MKARRSRNRLGPAASLAILVLGGVAITAALAACSGQTAPVTAPSGGATEPAETSTAASTAAADSPSTGSAGLDRIAFTRWADATVGQPALWTSNVDGSDAREVGQFGYYPDWSPDRSHLLFHFLDESGNSQIATIRPDGSGFRQLTDSIYNDAPDYSPNGTTIVFGRSEVPEDDTGFTLALWVMDADGANARPLLDPADGGSDYEPEYSPDGSAVVFLRYDPETDTSASYLVGADGADVRQVTPYDYYVEHPRWSPDGNTIIYNIEQAQDSNDPRNGIWTVAAAGGEPELLLGTTELLRAFKPDYSADGTRILFGCRDRGPGSDELCVMNADGTGVQQLTETPTYENHPVWD